MSLFLTHETQVFSSTGPAHLTNAVDWNNSYHRRIVAASLVNGVNILELDRQKKRRGDRALAPAWWESFGFKLDAELVDADNSVFGAIYVFQPEAYYYHDNSVHCAPRYVVAFRGTLLKADSVFEDLRLDMKVILSNLRGSPRYERAIKAVQKTVRDAGGPANIWIAGHSLGSSIAMLTGKTMAKMNYFIETYLFNPPFPSAPFGHQIKGYRVMRSLIKAGISAAVKEKPREDLFDGLYAWAPYLFVNPNDVICSEYINGYFEHRETMKRIGAGKFEKLATQNSFGSIFLGILGKESDLPPHLLPSAYLIINQSNNPDLIQAHELYTWWRPDVNLQIKPCIFKKEYFDQSTDTEA